MTRHLRPGVHKVRIKGQGMRRVKVLKSGKWRFLKGGATKRKGKKSKKGRKWVKGHWARR